MVGLLREEATHAAHREFGNVTLIEERRRDVWQWPRLESVLGDLKYAARQLWRSPGFTLTGVLTLAVSIGANTAIFSILNALLLKNLPYAHPERIGTMYARTSRCEAFGGQQNIDGRHGEPHRVNG